jgi:hypothetical protein
MTLPLNSFPHYLNSTLQTRLLTSQLETPTSIWYQSENNTMNFSIKSTEKMPNLYKLEEEK